MIWTMEPTAKKLEDVETKVGNVGSTDLQSQVNALSSNKTNYLLIDATSYAYDTKEGWDYVYGQMPDTFGGFVKVNFQDGYIVVGTAYKQNSFWGSIIGHLNSNHFPFFYNVHSGTSTLDGVTLNSKISTGEVAASNVTINTGTIDGTLIGHKVLGLYHMRLLVRGVSISNAGAFGRIANSTFYPLSNIYLKVFDYSNGKPINGSLYLNTSGVLAYYGDQLSNKDILIQDCFAVKG